jgi:4-amino-4-deoxy-L-arabinose transferase-like glycosyltransferase
MRRDLLILLGLVLLIRLPFIAQPIQGDDAFYLIFAKNALVDPLHPLQTSFRLGGDVVWGAGHTRPPGVAWTLAPLLALFGGVREVPLHLAYLLFSLLAVFSVYALARRFTERPLWAALVFASVPAFVINGNKLESDIPLLAFLSLGAACLVHRRYGWSALAMAVGAFYGYQSVFLVPVLAHWVWFRDRSRLIAWLPVIIAPLALVTWQFAEWLTAGAAPVQALAGYAQSYDLLLLERKLRSAAALIGHLGLMVSPVLVLAGWLIRSRAWALTAVVGGIAAAVSISGYTFGERLLYGVAVGCAVTLVVAILLLLLQKREGDEGFLAAWVVVCLGGALVLFYAGSARYLLPLAPALAILVAQRVSSRAWLAAGVAANLLLGLALARAEYHYDDQYKAFAEDLAPEIEGKRIWSNGDWGLRHYLGELGSESLLRGQELPGGSVLVTSELASAVPLGFAGARQQILSREVTTGWIPLRAMGRGSGSGYSSSEFGILPFGLGGGVIDRLTAEELGLPAPTESYLLMNADAAETQLLSGFYEVQSDVWRWMGPSGTAVLRIPDQTQSFEIDLYVPDNSPTRRITVALGGRLLADLPIAEPGGHVLHVPIERPLGASARVVLRVDATFSPAGDERDLSVVVNSFGFKPRHQ